MGGAAGRAFLCASGSQPRATQPRWSQPRSSQRGWTIAGQSGLASSIRAGQFELAGPAVLGFVFVVGAIEQICPAERR